MSEAEPRRRWRDRIRLKNRKQKDDSSSSLPVSSSASTDAVVYTIPIQQSTTPNVVVAEDSLWDLAYKNLQRANPILVQNFNLYLGLSTTDTEDGNPDYSRIDEVTRKALEGLNDAESSKESLNKTSATIRKYFEQAVKLVIASKDFISSAVSANPYAALAWTGVSLLLPLLLNPTQENEAAIKGLNYIANLIVVYKWQEKIYLHDDDAGSDFKDLAIALYTTILEYEATLLLHKHHNSLERWAKDVFQAGSWSTLVDTVHQHDMNCKNVTNAIAGIRAKEWQDEEREWQDKLLQQPRQSEERRHIRTLYSNYEAGKNVNPERVSGTCEWFLNHTSFLTWRESQSSSLLWLSADPGCGKSVLSKYLVDRRGEALSVKEESPIVCYFFFKDGDVNRTNGAKAICAFLHQLIMQRPYLYKYAREDFENKNETFLTDFDALWNIFLKATGDHSAGEIICVLDALDECQEQSRKILIAKLIQLYSLGGSTHNGNTILKFFVTSRPEFTVIRDFKGLTNTLSEVRLRGEEESEQISREIDLVIHFRVKELGSKMDLTEPDMSRLRENLSSIPHRTYLWLHLTFDDIEKRLELSKDEIAVITQTIPKDVDQAYTAILDKSPDRGRARKLLHIVLAASRPLTLQETNIAMTMKKEHTYYKDLDIWQPDVSEVKIKNMCGLFLSVVDSKVYLIHQTAREFLTCEERVDTPSAPQAFNCVKWKESFYLAYSNLLLAEVCIQYLQLRNFEEGEPKFEKVRLKRKEIVRYREEFLLLPYAAEYWATHFTQAGSLPDAALIETVANRTCDPHSLSFKIWSEIVPSYMPRDTNLMIASYLGHDAVVKLLLEQEDVQMDFRNGCSQTPLSLAAEEGHEAVARLLLEREDVKADSEDKYSQTPLSYAAIKGCEAVVGLLLKREDVKADSKDKYSRTPLSYAAERGHKAVVRLLLKREDVKADLKDKYSRTPLSYAAERGHEAVVRLLLEREDVKADSENKYDQTPLSYAAEFRHKEVVKILLEYNAQIDLEDKNGRTPLSYAAQFGHEEVASLLLEWNAQIDLEDKDGRTPLWYAKDRGHQMVIRLLEEHLHRTNRSSTNL